MTRSSLQGWHQRRVLPAAFLFVGLCAISWLATSTANAAPAKGTPVPVLIQMPLTAPIQNYPGIRDVAKAMEKHINSKGGIGGKPLKVVICDNKFTPTGVASCAQQGVKQKVVASIYGFNANPEQSYPVYVKAGIPVIGPIDLGASDYASPMAYPGATSIIALALGNAARAAQNGCKKPNLVIGEAFVQTFTGIVKAGYTAAGGTGSVGVTPVPSQATDMSTYVGSSTSNSDCIIFGLADQQLNQYARAFVQAGKKQRLIALYGAFTEKTLALVGGGKNSPLNGTLLTSASPAADNKAWAEYNGVVKKYIKNPKSVNDNLGAAKATYAGLNGFYQTFRNNKKTLTPALVRSKLNSLNSIPRGIPNFPSPVGNWKKPFSVNGTALPTFPRLPGASVLYLTVKNGKIVDQDNKWRNVAPGLVGAKIG